MSSTKERSYLESCHLDSIKSEMLNTLSEKRDNGSKITAKANRKGEEHTLRRKAEFT